MSKSATAQQSNLHEPNGVVDRSEVFGVDGESFHYEAIIPKLALEACVQLGIKSKPRLEGNEGSFDLTKLQVKTGKADATVTQCSALHFTGITLLTAS